MMKTLYSKFVITTMLVMIGSLCLGFLATNTYYHQVVKEKNDAKNVNIAREIASYIETTKPEDLDKYFTTLGRIGYQIYVTDGVEGQFFGGEYRDKSLSSKVVD
ncbi:sensor histidine kinase, partial [Bacillus sp. MHSD17]|nr:sensor histidine kinase [Bacillus sp. MHSD17]